MLARVSPRRISHAMRQLRQKVQAEPLAGNLRICASGTEIVVRDESGPWRTPAGQYLLEFEVKVNAGDVRVLDRPADKQQLARPIETGDDDAETHFDRAMSLEESDLEGAIRAYQDCLRVDPTNTAARINCGRLLHEAERITEAEEMYRLSASQSDDDPDLLFNRALLFEDTGREVQAVELYERAIAIAPDFADAHFNLARLFQELRMPRSAIRHWNEYRRLTLEREP